jgi:hypothetical protein
MVRYVTLGDLLKAGKWVEAGCSACNLISYLQPDQMNLKLNIEVPLIARWYKCPGCGATNTPDSHPIWVRPDPRQRGVI